MRFNLAAAGCVAYVLLLHLGLTAAFGQNQGSPDNQQQTQAEQQPQEAIVGAVFDYRAEQAQPGQQSRQPGQNASQKQDSQNQAQSQPSAASPGISSSGNQTPQAAFGTWDRAFDGAGPQNPQSRWWTFPHWNRTGLAWPDQHGFSGMDLAAADGALRAHLKLPKDQGLLVMSVQPGSPAAQAGIEQNDVLLKLGDSVLGKPEDLEKQLKAAGDKPVTLTFLRGGKSKTTHVQARVQVTFEAVTGFQPLFSKYWIGVSNTTVEPALRAQLGLPKNQGLLVTEVGKGTPAERAGIEVNDILLAFDDMPISDETSLIEAVQANAEKTVKLSLVRKGQKLTGLEVTPQRRPRGDVTIPPNTAIHQIRPYSMELVRPGVVNQSAPYYVLQLDGSAVQPPGQRQGQTADANAAITKRLDQLDAEIKQLHTLIENLGKAETTIRQLDKAVEALKEAAGKK
jgi:membrane-associated protease RseP (regulator of RpoE activity)